MIKMYVGVTDNKWFDFLSGLPRVDEVNFWQPSGKDTFRAVEPGSIFVFKLKAPRNMIGGFGVFSHATICPISLAWESFGEKNGTATFEELRTKIAAYRNQDSNRHQDFSIGCRIITEPVFFDEKDWLPVPPDFAPNLMVGKRYDVGETTGRMLWEQLQAYRRRSQPQGLEEEGIDIGRTTIDAGGARFGEPTLVRPRLGQGAFRLMVTDFYGRKCAVTSGKVLPALDVAHIQPYSDGGAHDIRNGILMRRDIHTLLDRGYVTIDPELRFVVSDRVRTEFNNGEEYRRLHGRTIFTPENPKLRPDPTLLDWHNRIIFQK